MLRENERGGRVGGEEKNGEEVEGGSKNGRVFWRAATHLCSILANHCWWQVLSPRWGMGNWSLESHGSPGDAEIVGVNEQENCRTRQGRREEKYMCEVSSHVAQTRTVSQPLRHDIPASLNHVFSRLLTGPGPICPLRHRHRQNRVQMYISNKLCSTGLVLKRCQTAGAQPIRRLSQIWDQERRQGPASWPSPLPSPSPTLVLSQPADSTLPGQPRPPRGTAHCACPGAVPVARNALLLDLEVLIDSPRAPWCCRGYIVSGKRPGRQAFSDYGAKPRPILPRRTASLPQRHRE
ncbi:hypothetical protein CC78DRAFT_580370 [Lojkania enalia]|uniref:Uncharacterized protein n=1 Tax=Lojkania enalia TaxID=147567 RepID=A0A9P4N6D8_9PLEO|nr:hypothetical protein CC78DRAFT_580370 [Didymosphaeria enalia]